ncbi:uncharacterized protein DS421_14g455620 [Arachis hypogaea]|nr:uncharacterized protein DS421_14g455620 [Arachis hypogaea]
MSMADDDAMDFGFDSIPKGKKKTFDFEKLDMNFNLDGEFENISSFKMDMSDLDFACTPKKSSQSKDKKGESSGGGKTGKENAFNFSFDFNELDNFNLDPSLIKRDTSSNKNLWEKVVTAEESDNAGAKMPKASNVENAHASTDSMAIKPMMRSTQGVTNDPQHEKSDKSLEDTAIRTPSLREDHIAISFD